MSILGMPGFMAPLLIPVGIWAFIYSLEGKSARRAGEIGIVFGLSHFGLMLWWLVPTISNYGRLPILAAIPVVGLLVVYLALYTGIWALLYRLPVNLSHMERAFWGGALWASMEWLRGTAFSGFPWGVLALGLSDHPILIQLADTFSIYGVSLFFFLFILLSYYFVSLVLKGIFKDALRVGLGLVFFLGIVLVYGGYRIHEMKWILASSNDTICLMAVQGAIHQTHKWDPDVRDRTLKAYFELTDAGIKGCAGENPTILAVWPETAVTAYIDHDQETLSRISKYVKEKGILLLFGAPSYDLLPGISRPVYYNSAYLMDKGGELLGRYDKRHLVPFGEYMPLGPFSELARRYLPTAGDFEPGRSGGGLRAGSGLEIGVLICFESIFSYLARESVLKGAHLLAVITNDAWFGRSQAPFQHEAMSVFRAVETRRWVIRAANTGISSIIDPTGTRRAATQLFVPAVIEVMGKATVVDSMFGRFGMSGFFALVLLLLGPIIGKMTLNYHPGSYRSHEHGSKDL